ncbi:hypothetical protein I552_6794 [Mycobacterium xenopi 3993]|nr:hypothetical protein I552_6794 [Mycobacterium xenopi 3993]
MRHHRRLLVLPGEAASNDDLTQVDAVVSALARAIADRMDIWLPFRARFRT